MAGFHFNSALTRLSAVYHRSLKIVLDQPTARIDLGGLLPAAEKEFPEWSKVNIKLVHEDVNDIKHTSGGLYDARTATPENASRAVGELLSLLETWTTRRQGVS